ncbi:MAG: AAA family ATPase [Archangiaceae bacterium]|nr:AAA family ATPase [Archangiaceae bacterium]
MQNYIKQANVNILGGLLAGTFEFSPGLNLVGGENGTMKTKLLQQLRAGTVGVNSVSGKQVRIQSINPKRNSERRAVEQIWQQIRQHNRTLDSLIGERVNAQITDTGFENNYPSLGDLFYVLFDHRAKDGGDRREHMRAVSAELNEVVRAIFQQYEIVSTWDESAGAPVVRIRKGTETQFPIEGLSLGEQEILALVASMYAVRDQVDVYLIDEPEVHLNWHLEQRLFAFMDDLCSRYEKQAIVVTHSRAMFTARFLPKVQFLYWEGNRVKWGPQLSAEQRRRIAGEAIEIIRLGDFARPTFFVEDSAHARVLEAISNKLGTQISVSQCGNSANVKSLFLLGERDGGWPNSFFLVDGDNQGNPLPGRDAFIHLPVYCIDNSLLCPEDLAAVFSKSLGEIQQVLFSAIQRRRVQILKNNRFFEFLMDQLRPDHLTHERLRTLDGSEIIDLVATELGTNVSDLTDRVVAYLATSNLLEARLPKLLIDAIRGPLPARAVSENPVSAAQPTP